MTQFHVSDGAAIELAEILDYISEHDGPDRARLMLEKFHRAFRLIGDAPGAGLQKLNYAPSNIRWWSVVPFFIVYDCESEPVSIEHVYHTARNLPDLFD